MALELTPGLYLSGEMKTALISSRNGKRAAAPTSVDRRQDTALKLWVVLARATNAISKHSEQDIARHDLTPTEFGILEVLHHKGPLLLGEIQRKILVTSGGITYLVDRLVEKGLVRRENSADDRRARYAVLTPAGRQLIKRIFPQHASCLEQALNGLTGAEQREAIALIKKLGLAAEAALQAEEEE